MINSPAFETDLFAAATDHLIENLGLPEKDMKDMMDIARIEHPCALLWLDYLHATYGDDTDAIFARHLCNRSTRVCRLTDRLRAQREKRRGANPTKRPRH